MTLEGILTLIGGIIVALISAFALLRSNKATGTTSSTQHAITEANDRAEAADRRATEADGRAQAAEDRAASFRRELGEVWTQMGALRDQVAAQQRIADDQEQQLSWHRRHIVYLETQIPNPPGAPPRPAGLHWPAGPGSASSANPPTA